MLAYRLRSDTLPRSDRPLHPPAPAAPVNARLQPLLQPFSTLVSPGRSSFSRRMLGPAPCVPETDRPSLLPRLLAQ